MALPKPSLKRAFAFAFQARSYSAPAERTVPASKQKYVPSSGTYPQGFLAGSSHAGVKASNTQYDDIALVTSETPCMAAGVFTRNLFKAAPVRASQLMFSTTRDEPNRFRGVVVNSGCANAVTGAAGLEDAHMMARAADACFEDTDTSQPPKTLVMSTGVIGQRLPMDKIKGAIPKAHEALGSAHDKWMSAAKAICTTDTFPKLLSRTFRLPSQPDVEYSIAGMTKGAGMIHPNMGTLLGIICTDAKVDRGTLISALRNGNRYSFNSITIDGDTSTNDTVFLLANGAAAPESSPPIHYPGRIDGAEPGSDAAAFRDVVAAFMADLAKLVVRDGEGATKFVTVRVKSDFGYPEAKNAANSIATSSLVKTALYGKDANWGRILCAIGYAPGIVAGTQRKAPDGDRHANKALSARFKALPSQTSVSFVPADGSEVLRLLVRGEPQAVDEERAKQILEMKDLEILVDMCDRDPAQIVDNRLRNFEVSEAVVWTCDFSHEYVTINGDYRT